MLLAEAAELEADGEPEAPAPVAVGEAWEAPVVMVRIARLQSIHLQPD